MSHVTTIDLHITDLDALKKACERLGLELVCNQRTFLSYQRGLKCDHLIRVKGNEHAYQMGLIKGTKGYTLSWDAMMASELRVATSYDGGKDYRKANADKLKDWYAAEVARKEMRKKGFMVKTTQGKGKVEVLCSK